MFKIRSVKETMDNRKGGFGRSQDHRDNRGPRRDFNNRGPRRDEGPREMHKAVCADCKKECEVPFKPSEDRPVYCRECFANHRSSN